MSIAAALQDMFSVPELTHPVQLGAESTRAYLNESGELMPFGGADIQIVGPVLYIRKDTLPALAQGSVVTVGALGASTATGGRDYRVHRLDPIEDGLILACTIGGGR